MLRPITIALLPALLMVLPAAAQDFQKGSAAYKRGDYATAYQELRPLAERGNARAQNSLGLMYRYGRGVRQDYGEAAKWYRKAAERGMPWPKTTSETAIAVA